jgi:hypothetical protein
MTPPDSGEREVLTANKLAELRFRYEAIVRGSARMVCADGTAMLVATDAMPLAAEALRALPYLLAEVEHHRAHCPSRDLAQRILAALDDHGCEYDAQCRALASELRAIVERKT